MSTTVLVETTSGSFQIELDDARAPGTVANFLSYVDAGHYSGTIFHRIIPGFMAQGGGYNPGFDKIRVNAGITNEADNGVKNHRGTVAMARTGDPHSATAQFFVNLSDNAFLDHTAPAGKGWGYAVFGKVVSGMESVDAMVAIPTGPSGPFRKDCPTTTVEIIRITRA